MCSFHTQKVCGALLLAHVISPTRLPFSFLSLCSVLNQPVYDNMTFKIVPQILKTNGNFFHIRRGFNQQFRDGAKTVIYQFKTDGPTMDMMSISAVVKSLSQISLHQSPSILSYRYRKSDTFREKYRIGIVSVSKFQYQKVSVKYQYQKHHF